MSKLNIGHRLAIIIIGFSMSAILLVAFLFFRQFEEALIERVFLQLSSVRQLKASRILSELESYKEKFTQQIDQNPDSAAFEFYELGFYNAWPGKSLHPKLPDTPPQETLKIVNITEANMSEPISLAFIANRDQGYYIALASLPQIQNILLERTGLGQTGETYLVDQELNLLSLSRFNLDNPRNTKIETEAVSRAFSGITGEALIRDYRQKMVFSAFDRISIGGLEWAIISEIDYQEALIPLNNLKDNLAYILLGILILLILGSFLVSKMLVRPVQTMEKKLTELSHGKIEGIRAPIQREDEIGRMFTALNRLVEALRETIRYADEIGAGNFGASYNLMSDQDQMGKALILMKDKLKAFQEREDHLRKANQQSMLDGEEKERQRLSKEMHDGLGPLLTTFRLQVQSNISDSSRRNELLKTLDEIIDEVRHISNNLMPSVLADFGAGEAIGNLLQRIKKEHSLEVRYKNDMQDPGKINRVSHILIYRVAQEAINNIIRHAEATTIKASVTAFDDRISFFMADNGRGFDTRATTSGHGLRNMKERVKLASGIIDISSTSNGTVIEFEIPIYEHD